MAMSDYRLCDVCGHKAFYDADLNYSFPPYHSWFAEISAPFRDAGVEPEGDIVRLDRLGDWAVLCRDCAKTHKTQIVPIEAPTQEPKP